MILLNHLGVATQGLNDAIESMTSGYKINHAKDNAANFGIVTNLTTRINSLQVREDNASLGLELVSNVSSGVESITNSLQQIRSLAMTAVNGTYGNTSLASLQKELKSRLDEIQRTTDSLSFENRKIFEKHEPTTTKSKARAQNSPTQTISTEADGDTTFAELGITDLSLDLYYTNGNKMNSFTLDSGDKINKLLTVLNSYGFKSSISNGVIKIDSSNGNYIKGALADALGITTSTKTLVTNTTSSSNNKITYTTTALADSTTTFAQVGLNLAGKTLQVKSKADNSILGTITVDNNSETFKDLFDALDNYGISASINNGKVQFSSSDKYITGDVASLLGITTSSTNSTITTGQTTTSSSAIKYTITSNATEVNTLADLGISDTSVVIENNTGTALKTISVSSTTTLNDLFNTLNSNTVTLSLTDGVISVSGDNVITGALADALGIGKVVKGTDTKTVGIAYKTDTITVDPSLCTSISDNEFGVDISMPAKDALLKSITYVDASGCQDVLDVESFTANTTYKITSTEGLQKLATLVNNKNSGEGSTFVLMNDIDLSSIANWTPIGDDRDSRFRGNFYGNGYMISNMKISNSDFLDEAKGLFGYCLYGSIQDLVINDARFKFSNVDYVGILCGLVGETHIKNVAVSGYLNVLCGFNNELGGVVGRFVGGNESMDSVNAYINADLLDPYSASNGGLVGHVCSGTISNCYVSGNWTGEDYSRGALCGQLSGRSTISSNATTIDASYGIREISADTFSTISVYSNKFKNSSTLYAHMYATLDDFTHLNDIGITTTQTISLYNNGTISTITVDGSDHMCGIQNRLKNAGLDIEISIPGGYWSIAASDTCYIVDVSDGLRNILKLDAGEGKTYKVTTNNKYANNSAGTKFTSKNLQNLTASSKLSDIGIVSDKTITVSQNDSLKTVTVKSTDTIDDLSSKLSKVGITATLSNGKLTFAGSSSAYIKNMSSELSTALGISVGNGQTYGETTKSTYSNNQSNNTYKTTGTNELTTSSMLNELKNITFGNIRVRNSSGAIGTISVSNTNSMQDFFNKIKNYGITGSISGGKVTLTSDGDNYLETISGGSNLLSVLNMSAIKQTKSTITEHSPSNKLTYQKSLDDWTTYTVDLAIGGISNDADYKIGLNLNFGMNYALDITTKAGAEKALNEVDAMLKYLQKSQSDIGSTQNRLLSVLDEISVQYENLVSSRSTLRDADIAKVSSKYLRNQIMQQAATTLLAVANQNPSIALGLI